MRYTEAKLKRISDELLSDINKDTVDFQPNYDDTLKEPTVLPSKFPNLLVIGASGIAVGMATNMAPHNLTEVIEGTIHYIENRGSAQCKSTIMLAALNLPGKTVIKAKKSSNTIDLTEPKRKKWFILPLINLEELFVLLIR